MSYFLTALLLGGTNGGVSQYLKNVEDKRREYRENVKIAQAQNYDSAVRRENNKQENERLDKRLAADAANTQANIDSRNSQIASNERIEANRLHEQRLTRFENSITSLTNGLDSYRAKLDKEVANGLDPQAADSMYEQQRQTTANQIQQLIEGNRDLASQSRFAFMLDPAPSANATASPQAPSNAIDANNKRLDQGKGGSQSLLQRPEPPMPDTPASPSIDDATTMELFNAMMKQSKPLVKPSTTPYQDMQKGYKSAYGY